MVLFCFNVQCLNRYSFFVFCLWKDIVAWYIFHIQNIYISVLCQRELGWLQQSYEKELFLSQYLVPQFSDNVSFASTKTFWCIWRICTAGFMQDIWDQTFFRQGVILKKIAHVCWRHNCVRKKAQTYQAVFFAFSSVKTNIHTALKTRDISILCSLRTPNAEKIFCIWNAHMGTALLLLPIVLRYW